MLSLFQQRVRFLTILLIFGSAWTAYSQDHPKYEMRAVWIATVANIDWPSTPGLTVEKQKQELIELLDLVKEYHMNTIVFQIRPAADAMYPSTLEPWSQWLMGKQGKAPEPMYDPLQYAIQECHKRGIDIHVWLNPYRAVKDIGSYTDPNHITNIHPDWFLDYGNTRYFDPGLPQTRDFVSRVVSDIVRRYDIDAVHMDDYFYPYRITGKNFPDDNSFNKYHGKFDAAHRDDWRRNNVDLIIKQIHDSIKAIKSYVEFGISPFGVWRNKDKDSTGSDTKAGQTNYDDLFADIQKWQKEGWIDYVTPQIYWEIGFKVANFGTLTDWWSKNSWGTMTYIGQAPYRINPKANAKAWQSSNEIINQIKMLRSTPGIKGSMFFSAKFLRSNPLELKQKLLATYYKFPALVPANPRITPIKPSNPDQAFFTKSKKTIHLKWVKGFNTKEVVIYDFGKFQKVNFNNTAHILKVTSDSELTIDLNTNKKLKHSRFYVISISQTHTESKPIKFKAERNK